jgi:hypothetical protein
LYDANNGRIYNENVGGTEKYYLRSASGATIGTYNIGDTEWEWEVAGSNHIATLTSSKTQYYEYDHLGGVRTTYVTSINCSTSVVNYNVLNMSDYYANGKLLRNFAGIALDQYGYQGSEREHAISDNDYYTLFRGLDADIIRWKQFDPKWQPNWSPYNTMNSNPILLLDILGDKPSPKEAAAIAAHVYGDKSDKILIGGWKLSDKKIDNTEYNTGQGLKSALYEREITSGKDKGKLEYVYATAGTEDMTDAAADAAQVVAISIQYNQSVENARKISGVLGRSFELTFVGHSLGGGEAAANAYATGRTAITFNAAGLSNQSISRYGLHMNAKIEAYVMCTDPLNLIQNKLKNLPNVNGKINYLWPVNESSVINGHSMDNVLNSMGVKNIPKESKSTPQPLNPNEIHNFGDFQRECNRWTNWGF